MSNRITNEDDLIAGILYCLVTRRFDYERDHEYDSLDALVYWDGYNFIHDDGERCNDEWDSVIPQSEKADARYISGPQFTFVDGKEIDVREYRKQSIAKWRAECASRGVIV